MISAQANAWLIQRLEAAQKVVEMKLEKVVKEEKEKEEKVGEGGGEEEDDDDENLVFDYSNDFKQKKPTTKIEKKEPAIKLLEQPFEIQPFDQFSLASWSHENGLKIEEFKFYCWMRCNLKDTSCNVLVTATRPLQSIFKSVAGTFRVTNINFTNESVVGFVYSKNGRNINLKLEPPHEGYITLELFNVCGTPLNINLDEKIAMNFKG